MLLDTEGFHERKARKAIALRKTIKRTVVVLSIISEAGHCFSFRPQKPTDVFYVLEGKENFTLWTPWGVRSCKEKTKASWPRKVQNAKARWRIDIGVGDRKR